MRRWGLNLPFTWCGVKMISGYFVAFQNFLMHFLVAGFVATVAAGGVHNNRAACFAGTRIEMNLPIF